MKILFVITILSFLVLASALFLVTRHIRAHAAEAPDPNERAPLTASRRTAKRQRRAGRRKAIRATA